MNQANLSGRLIELSVLRYTPAGVALINLELEHSSTVQEAGSERALLFEVQASALGEIAVVISQLSLGNTYTFGGFWAPAHYRTKRLGFHIQSLLHTASH